MLEFIKTFFKHLIFVLILLLSTFIVGVAIAAPAVMIFKGYSQWWYCLYIVYLVLVTSFIDILHRD